MKRERRRLSVLVTPQTLWNLQRLSFMAGYGDDIGRTIDKLTREKMIALKNRD